jgi:hypothetical protein
VIGAVREIGPGWWLLAVAVTTGTDILDFVTLPRPEAHSGAALAVAVLLRVALLFWAGYALLRRLAGRRHPMRLTPGIGRFALFTLAMLIVFAVVSQIVLAGVAGDSLATRWLAMFAVAAVWGIATIRLIGLSAAFANGIEWRAAGGVVRATRGHAPALAACFAQIILPFAAIHLALTLLAVELPLAPRALVALAVLDGAVSAVQLLLTLALSHAAWRIDARRFP